MSFRKQSQSAEDITKSQNPQNDKPTLVIENLFLNVVSEPKNPPVVEKEKTKNGVILHCEDLFLRKQMENLSKCK